MLSVKKILAGRGAVNYYLDQTRRGLADYYLAEQTPEQAEERRLTAPGTAWWGGGSRVLGLEGSVDLERFVPLFTEGLHPDGDHALGRRFRLPEEVAQARYLALRATWQIEDPGRRAQAQFEASQLGGRPSVAAWDCTFSPVKSVSLLWAAGDRAVQEQVWAAHSTAVDHGLAYLEEHGAYVRAGRNGARVLDSDGLVVARMNEWTSRSGDMQLHTHCVVLNRARTTSDGKWRALDGRELLAARIGAGAVYNRVLETELTRRLGVAWRDRPDGLRELIGVDDELIQLFSSRRRSITAELDVMIQAYEDTYGVEPSPAVRWSMAQQATLATRNGKHEPSATQALATWEDTARAQGRRLADLPDQVLGRQVTSTAAEPPTDADVDGLLRELATTEHATVNRHGLLRAALDVLPATADPADEVRARAEALVERSLGSPGLVRVTVPAAEVPTSQCRRDGTSVWERPGQPLWALRATLDQEDYLLRVTTEPTGLTIAGCWIDEVAGRHGLGVDQADAVRVLVGSDQRIGLLVGAAGSGKTRALGAAVDAWRLSDREVIGLTVSQAAADVLATEAGVRAENIAKWRLETGRGRWRLSPESLVIVDEASMVSTPDLVDLVVQVRGAGARMLLVGDPAQLDAIGIGGAFELLADRHGATVLHEVRRFVEPWEREASLRLRDRDPSALIEYLRNDRVFGGTIAEVEDEMFRAWEHDVLAADTNGRRPTVLMIVRTNDQAATLSEHARRLRVRAGLVDPGPTVRLHDTVASRGDQIVTRRNDRTLRTSAGGWVVNGDVWTVAAAHADGSATAIRARDGDRIRLPGTYLATHAHLAYATTAHRAQGMTVDRCHAFIDGSEAHHLLYVAATRGRDSNRLWVGLDTPHRKVLPGSPITVLLDILHRQDERRRAATAIRDDPPALMLTRR